MPRNARPIEKIEEYISILLYFLELLLGWNPSYVLDTYVHIVWHGCRRNKFSLSWIFDFWSLLSCIFGLLTVWSYLVILTLWAVGMRLYIWTCLKSAGNWILSLIIITDLILRLVRHFVSKFLGALSAEFFGINMSCLHRFISWFIRWFAPAFTNRDWRVAH